MHVLLSYIVWLCFFYMKNQRGKRIDMTCWGLPCFFLAPTPSLVKISVITAFSSTFLPAYSPFNVPPPPSQLYLFPLSLIFFSPALSVYFHRTGFFVRDWTLCWHVCGALTRDDRLRSFRQVKSRLAGGWQSTLLRDCIAAVCCFPFDLPISFSVFFNTGMKLRANQLRDSPVAPDGQSQPELRYTENTESFIWRWSA